MISIKTLALSTVAASAIATSAVAQSSSPFSGPSSLADSFISSGPVSSLQILPTAIALGVGIGLDPYEMLDYAVTETIYGGDPRYNDFILFWELSTISFLPTYLQLGYYKQRGDVERVVNSTGTSFNTNGKMKESGAFAGVGVKVPLNQMMGGTTNVAPPPADLGVADEPKTPTLNFAVSLGIGRQHFDAFGGGFSDDQVEGFRRIEAGVDIPIGEDGFYITPGVVNTKYTGSEIRGSNTIAVIRGKFKF